MSGFTWCRACNGDGTVTINPAHPDPQGAYDVLCEDCRGTGTQPMPYRDADHFDRMSDARAEAGEPHPCTDFPRAASQAHPSQHLSSPHARHGLTVVSGGGDGATDEATPGDSTPEAA